MMLFLHAKYSISCALYVLKRPSYDIGSKMLQDDMVRSYLMYVTNVLVVDLRKD